MKFILYTLFLRTTVLKKLKNHIKFVDSVKTRRFIESDVADSITEKQSLNLKSAKFFEIRLQKKITTQPLAFY